MYKVAEMCTAYAGTICSVLGLSTLCTVPFLKRRGISCAWCDDAPSAVLFLCCYHVEHASLAFFVAF